MNERIKELAIKAQVEHCISHVRLEQFAELIVNECAHLADTLNEAYDAPSTAGKFIKEHFGVEK